MPQDPRSVDDRPRIPLSVPHATGAEGPALQRAVESNWIATVGPELPAFEEEFAEAVGSPYALATSSGTAAMHLCLRVLGVESGDEVLVSSLTFCASVNPIIYQQARPVFVDSEASSWNVDPELLVDALDRRGRDGDLPAAVIVVHLFGQPVDMPPIVDACRRWGVPLIEDAAEALGTRCHGTNGNENAWAGTVGDMGIYSFDGSKMITTSMGGMLVAHDENLVDHARKLARQAREDVPHYEHTEIGYNYRMSNLLAAVGRVQLTALPRRVDARRTVYRTYQKHLGDLPGVKLQPDTPHGVHSRWLTSVLIDPAQAAGNRETVRQALLAEGIESRPVWKPMHLQPVYRGLGYTTLGGEVAEALFEQGLCLPSSSSMREDEVAEVCSVIRNVVRPA